jgi:hypothetical protein
VCKNVVYGSKSECPICYTSKGETKRPDRAPGDWDCLVCGQVVFKRKPMCFKCFTPKGHDKRPSEEELIRLGLAPATRMRALEAGSGAGPQNDSSREARLETGKREIHACPKTGKLSANFNPKNVTLSRMLSACRSHRDLADIIERQSLADFNGELWMIR